VAHTDHIAITVQDTGPGIDPTEHKRVFEPFYRSTAQRRFPQGLGLGLNISQEIVAAHGGTLQLKSVPGEGAAFTIILPVAPA
jgi:two-component system OmpR family sensor kinase